MVDHSYWLAPFAAWAELRGVDRPADVTFPVLEAFQRHVSLRRKPDGTPLSWSTQARALVALRAFFAWCKKTRRLLSNPAAELVMPRQSHKLPGATLTHAEPRRCSLSPMSPRSLGCGTARCSSCSTPRP